MFPAPKPDPISDRNCQNLYPFSDQNGSKTIPFGAAHTYIPYIGEYPPGGISITSNTMVLFLLSEAILTCVRPAVDGNLKPLNPFSTREPLG